MKLNLEIKKTEEDDNENNNGNKNPNYQQDEITEMLGELMVKVITK